MAATMHVRRRVTEWGNGYGIRITKAEARKLGIRPGDLVDVEVRGEPQPNDVSKLPTFRLGGAYDIDAILDEEGNAGG